MALTLYAPGSVRATGNFLSSASVNLSVNTGTGARLLVVDVILRGNPAAATVTYAGEELDVAAADANLAIRPNLVIGQFWLPDPAPGNNTLTVSLPATSATSYEIQVAVFNGDSEVEIDQVNTSQGSGTTPAVSLTTTEDDAKVVSGLVTESATPPAANQGTPIHEIDNGAWGTGMCEVNQVSAGPLTVSWSTGNDAYICVAVAYIEAGGPEPEVVTGAAVLSGSGGLSAQATNVVLAQAQLSGAGGTAGAALNHALAEATLAAGGHISGSPILIVLGAGQLVGSGAIEAVALLVRLASGQLSGTGALSGDSQGIVPATAQLLGAGGLQGAAILIVPAGGALAASGALSGAAEIIGAAGLVYGAASLVGSGALSAAGQLTVLGQAQLSGEANLQGTPTLTVFGAGNLTGAGEAQGAALLIVQAVVALIGSGMLSATGRIPDLTVVLPDGRTLVVSDERRIFEVEPETRFFTVEPQTRTLAVEPDLRTLFVERDIRTLEA